MFLQNDDLSSIVEPLLGHIFFFHIDVSINYFSLVVCILQFMKPVPWTCDLVCIFGLVSNNPKTSF